MSRGPKEYLSIQRRAFTSRKGGAKRRGIEWQLTFDEWLQIWEASGHIHERGSRKGGYVMARHGDLGPYSRDNVSIILHEQNSRDTAVNHPLMGVARTIRQVGSGRGWMLLRPGKYLVSVAKRYIGIFDSADEARAAYLAASEAHKIAKTAA